MSIPLLQVRIEHEHDVVLARQRARDIAAALGFDGQDQTRIATAVSEISRNAFEYAGRGWVEFEIEGQTTPQLLQIGIRDRGPGIAELQRILEGRYQSPHGMGLGILGARRLMDQLHVESSTAGTTVVMRKLLPRRAERVTAERAVEIAASVDDHPGRDPFAELRRQNQELVRALDALRQRQEDLQRLNQELEDTNRGVVALYAELDERADHLRHADDLKSRFLSNMSHEFRTPLNSILALTRLLLDRTDGPLSAEQEKQVGFVRKAAEGLSELVNDLLDLAKVEAGKIVVRPDEFTVEELFGALRGMLRPILVGDSVELVFDLPPDGIRLYSDEGKVSQILRNFISNAIKFTPRGEVRVSAEIDGERDVVRFAVADTGIGIPPEHHERIFEEFAQVEHPMQKRYRGTGLGLPLSRKLAHLLGGEIVLESQPGRGSTFTLVVPRLWVDPEPQAESLPTQWQPDPLRTPVLVLEDSPETQMLYARVLRPTRYEAVPVRSVREANSALQRFRPGAVVLDILLRGEDSWSFLAAFKSSEATRDIPVIVVTNVEDRVKAEALGADAFASKPLARDWLLDRLDELTCREPGQRILVVDDEPMARYLFQRLLGATSCRLLEAEDGEAALQRVREQPPDLVLLDLALGATSGFEVLQRLKDDPATQAIPVVVATSKVLSHDERCSLERQVEAVLTKDIAWTQEGVDIIRGVLKRAASRGGAS
jgi:signal transduction histidine kinase/DNA-binding response OmpR family regulator